MTERRTKKRDCLKIPAHLILIAAILLTVSDVYRVFMARRRIADRINQAVSASNQGEYARARNLLVLARRQSQKLRHNNPTHRLVQKVLPFSPDFDARFARVHKGIGIWFTESQQQRLAVKHYTLALLYDTSINGVAEPLARQCVHLQNYQLGLASSRLAYRKTGRKTVKKMVNFFEKQTQQSD